MISASNPSVRIASAVATGAIVLSLTGCGDDSAGGSPVDSVPSSSAPGTTSVSTIPPTVPASTVPGIEHPVGADDVVLRIGYEGGYVPVEAAFLNLPTLLVTGGGQLIVQGPQIEIYPGPLLPNLQVRSISEVGVQQLLAMAADHGLLTEREYTNPTNIADAPDTVVVVAANGETYEHRAYALGLDTEADELRKALADFVVEVTGEWMYGDNPELGPEQPYTSETFLVRASEVDDPMPSEPAPTFVDWPSDQVPLSEAIECLAVPAAGLGELFGEANQLTIFRSGGAEYRLSVKPLLPGDGC
jgi:hypothetical protein